MRFIRREVYFSILTDPMSWNVPWRPRFIIEAVSFNKPFIISKETGLNEIYPEGGLFFDPHRPDELERSMEAALDYRIYNKLVEELKENAISHSWKNIAEEYLDIWKRI